MKKSLLLSGALLLATVFQSPLQAAVCPLPDLARPSTEAPREFEVIEAPDGSLRVRMTNNLADPAELLPGDPEGKPPSRPQPPGLRWLYSEATDWLQVPRSLQVRDAAVGIDGSWMLRMDDGKGAWLWASSTGSCVGCAVSEGSGWFPALAAQARSMEIEPCTVFRPSPQRVPQGSTRVRFNYRPLDGVRHDGVVRQQTGRDDLGDVRQLLVAGLPQTVRDAVLSRF